MEYPRAYKWNDILRYSMIFHLWASPSNINIRISHVGMQMHIHIHGRVSMIYIYAYICYHGEDARMNCGERGMVHRSAYI